MPLVLILLLLASSLGLTSCAGTPDRAMERAPILPAMRTPIDSAPRCPAPEPCPPPPDHRLVGLPADIDTVLWLRLDSLVRTLHDPTGGILGAAVLRTRDSALVWQRNPDLRILPASTMKVLMAAAALEDLGPEFRWKTSVWSTAPIVNGILKGDLILEGGGDPTFGVEGVGMTPLVSALARAGLKEVHGDLVALDTMVGRDLDAWPSGWTITNSRDGYGAPITGLNWGQNRTSTRSIGEPRRLALSVFAKALATRKIKVRGADTTILVRGDALPSRQGWTLLAKVQSPRLSEVLRICLVHSVNPYAEAAILAMGVHKPSGKLAPRDQGKRRFRQILTQLGMPSSITADDGSGLSRYNLATARAMADLLRRDLTHPEGTRATDLLPRGGQGTLRHRFGRLPSPTWVSGKTGTLDGTSTLVGILRVPGRDTLTFAFLSTGFQGRASRIRGFQDRLILSLAGEDQLLAPDSIAPADSTTDLDDLPVDSAPRVPPVLPESLAIAPTAPESKHLAPAPPMVPSMPESGSPPTPPSSVLPPASALPPSISPSASDKTTSHPVRREPGPSPISPPRSPQVVDTLTKAPKPPVAQDHVSNLPAQRRPSDLGGPTPFLWPSPTLLPMESARPTRPDSSRSVEAPKPDSTLPPPSDSLGSPPIDSSIVPTSTDAVVLPPADSSSTPGIANDSRSPVEPNFDSLPVLQTTPPDPEMDPVRDSESPLVPSGTDPDKVTP